MDVGGNPEDLLYYEVYRAPEGGLSVLVDKVVIDMEPGTPWFQWYDTVPPRQLPHLLGLQRAGD